MCLLGLHIFMSSMGVVHGPPRVSSATCAHRISKSPVLMSTLSVITFLQECKYARAHPYNTHMYRDNPHQHIDIDIDVDAVDAYNHRQRHRL